MSGVTKNVRPDAEEAGPTRAREDAAEREVKALHQKVKALADAMAVYPETMGKAGDLFLAVAKQTADNAGLAKRYAVRVEAKVATAASVDDWVNEGAE